MQKYMKHLKLSCHCNFQYISKCLLKSYFVSFVYKKYKFA